jgi:hypothetical protein
MATTKGIFNSVLNAFSFGTSVSKSENTNYQAEEDGFFVGRVLGNSSVAAVVRFDVYTDATATPTTLVTSCFGTGHGNAQYWNGGASGFMIPVKKNNYYRVTRTDVSGTQGYAITLTWVPFSKTSST